MAVRPRAIRNLLSRVQFFEAGAAQLAIEPVFARAAAEVHRSFAHLGVTFNETQVALSRVLGTTREAGKLDLFDLGAKTLVRDFPLVSAFEDVIGAKTRFVAGVNIDLEKFSGGVLHGGAAHFTFEFKNPPTIADIRDRLENFRTFPGEHRRYERLRSQTHAEPDFSAVHVEFVLRLT